MVHFPLSCEFLGGKVTRAKLYITLHLTLESWVVGAVDPVDMSKSEDFPPKENLKHKKKANCN